MKQFINKLKEFNKAFKVPVDGTLDKPSELRFKLMREENEEYIDALAIENKDVKRNEIADAIGDQLYILCGTILHHGLEDKIEAIFNEIHDSNMSKLEDGKPVINGKNGVMDWRKPKGKIIKGKDFKEPCFNSILN